jgi:hypothetical protein
VVVALPGAPAAQASDESVRAVAQAQAARQIPEDRRFARAMRRADQRGGLSRLYDASKRQTASIQTWHDALKPERADMERVADGRRELLSALTLYNKGLKRLRTAIRQALHAGGNSGVAQAQAAIRNMETAIRRVERAAKKLG